MNISENASIGGTLAVTGLITATAGVSGAVTGAITGNVTGNLTGDVTGNVTGNVTGAVTGDVTGDLTGDVTGNVTGNLIGQHRHSTQALATSGAISIASGVVLLANTAAGFAATLPAPAAGDELYIINASASGTQALTVTTAEGVTWNGTNTVATLDAVGDCLHVVAISATRWFILENIGSVGLS